MQPNLITKKGDKTFKFYFFTINEYESGLDYNVESEVLLFKGECIEMDGYISEITQSDETSLYYSMNCSVNLIEEIKSNDYLIVTSFYH